MKILSLTPTTDIPGLDAKLSSFGDVNWEMTQPSKRTDDISTVEAIFVNPNCQKYKLDASELSVLPALRWIVTASTGLDHIDQDYCAERNISIVSLTNEYEIINSITSTAEHAWLLTLMAARRSFDAMRELAYNSQFNYTDHIGSELAGKTVAVIGYGRLGRMYAKYALAFDMHVLAVDIVPINDNERITPTTLHYAFKQADIISLHVHHTAVTHHMINAELLSLCEHRPIIVNTARGGLVDEDAMLDAMRKNQVSIYATDVYENEQQLGASNKITKAYDHAMDPEFYQRLIMTPHMGGMTHDARYKAYHGVLNTWKRELNAYK